MALLGHISAIEVNKRHQELVAIEGRGGGLSELLEPDNSNDFMAESIAEAEREAKQGKKFDLTG